MNEILIGVGVGLLLIFVAVISGALLLVKVARSGNRPVQQPTAASTHPRTFKEVMIPYTPWLIGITVLVVCALAYHFNKSLTLGIFVLWMSGLLFAGIALYGLRYSSGGSLWFTRIAGVVIVVITLSALLFGDKTSEVGAKIRKDFTERALSANESTDDESKPSDKPLGPLPQGRVWETKSVVWDEMNPDGSIPINTPSATIQIPNYCTVLYADGNGREFQVLYRAIEGGWEPHQRGQHTPGDAFRIMVIKKGVKEVAYKQSCP